MVPDSQPLILHTIKNISRHTGGVPVAVVQLLEAIAEQAQGTSIKLAASPGDDPLLSRTYIRPAFEWEPLSSNFQRSFRSVLHKAGKSSQVNRPLLIHDHGIWLPNNHIVAIEARRFRIPRVVSIHGMLEPWALQHRTYRKRVAWYLFQKHDLRTAQVLHATAKEEALNLKKICPQVPVAVVPLGVELPTRINQRLNVSSKRTALFLSRIHVKKGLLNLVEAWAHLQHKSWDLIIAGPDENGYRAVIERRVKELGLTASIRFEGLVSGEAKWKLFQEADLFVLPTFSENFGIVVAEALAHGVPVITTKGAPWSDLLTYRCGWWIETGVSPLVEALQEAMALSQAERTEMGDRGRQMIEAKYTWKRTAEQMLHVYKWVLGQSSKPTFVMD
jgi:glycosyltransferase involved in cell wall biosynthesis